MEYMNITFCPILMFIDQSLYVGMLTNRIPISSTLVMGCSTSSIATRVAVQTTFFFMPWGSGGSHRPFTTSAFCQALLWVCRPSSVTTEGWRSSLNTRPSECCSDTGNIMYESDRFVLHTFIYFLKILGTCFITWVINRKTHYMV